MPKRPAVSDSAFGHCIISKNYQKIFSTLGGHTIPGRLTACIRSVSVPRPFTHERPLFVPLIGNVGSLRGHLDRNSGRAVGISQNDVLFSYRIFLISRITKINQIKRVRCNWFRDNSLKKTRHAYELKRVLVLELSRTPRHRRFNLILCIRQYWTKHSWYALVMHVIRKVKINIAVKHVPQGQVARDLLVTE